MKMIKSVLNVCATSQFLVTWDPLHHKGRMELILYIHLMFASMRLWKQIQNMTIKILHQGM